MVAGPSHDQVKALRQRSGAALKQCKEALSATGCDLDAAEQWLAASGGARPPPPSPPPPPPPPPLPSVLEADVHYEQYQVQLGQAEEAQRAQAEQAQLAAVQAQLAAQASAAQATAPGGSDIFSGLAVQSAGANTAAADALFASPPSAMMAAATAAGWPCPSCTLDNAATDALCAACGAPRPQEEDIMTSGMFGGMALASGSHGGGTPAAPEAALGYTSPPALPEAKSPSSADEVISDMFAGLATNPPPPTASGLPPLPLCHCCSPSLDPSPREPSPARTPVSLAPPGAPPPDRRRPRPRRYLGDGGNTAGRTRQPDPAPDGARDAGRLAGRDYGRSLGGFR